MDLLILCQFVLAGLSAGAVYALIALGFSVVHNATGIVNFAQGDFLVVGAFVAYSVLVSWGLPYWVAFLAAVFTAALVGFLLERWALSRSRSKEILLLVFITVGASIFLRGLIKEIWGKRPFVLPPISETREISWATFAIDPQYFWIIGITLLAFASLHFFFRHTLWGKAIRAVAIDAEAAALMGIPVPWAVAASFALAGALGGLAGVLIGPIWPLSFESGVHIGLKGFAAAVLGGYGSFGGALLGGFLLGLLEGLGAYFTSSLKNLIAYGILLLVLLLRPQGLLGEKVQERL